MFAESRLPFSFTFPSCSEVSHLGQSVARRCFGGFSEDVSRVETAASPGLCVLFRTTILVPGYFRSPSNLGLLDPGLDNFLECPRRGACPCPSLYSPTLPVQGGTRVTPAQSLSWDQKALPPLLAHRPPAPCPPSPGLPPSPYR